MMTSGGSATFYRHQPAQPYYSPYKNDPREVSLLVPSPTPFLLLAPVSSPVRGSARSSRSFASRLSSQLDKLVSRSPNVRPAVANAEMPRRTFRNVLASRQPSCRHRVHHHYVHPVAQCMDLSDPNNAYLRRSYSDESVHSNSDYNRSQQQQQQQVWLRQRRQRRQRQRPVPEKADWVDEGNDIDYAEADALYEQQGTNDNSIINEYNANNAFNGNDMDNERSSGSESEELLEQHVVTVRNGQHNNSVVYLSCHDNKCEQEMDADNTVDRVTVNGGEVEKTTIHVRMASTEDNEDNEDRNSQRSLELRTEHANSTGSLQLRSSAWSRPSSRPGVFRDTTRLLRTSPASRPMATDVFAECFADKFGDPALSSTTFDAADFSRRRLRRARPRSLSRSFREMSRIDERAEASLINPAPPVNLRKMLQRARGTNSLRKLRKTVNNNETNTNINALTGSTTNKERSNSFGPRNLRGSLSNNETGSSHDEVRGNCEYSRPNSSNVEYDMSASNDSKKSEKSMEVRRLLSTPLLPESQRSVRVRRRQKVEHVYEEIGRRPLPPVPDEEERKTSNTSSIFEGASKSDILHYLEDARHRQIGQIDDGVLVVQVNNSNIADEEDKENTNNTLKWTTSAVEIERNDSGLGSETSGKKNNKSTHTLRPATRVRTFPLMKHQRSVENLCEDCDQVIEVNETCNETNEEDEDDDEDGIKDKTNNPASALDYDPLGPTCLPCHKRRVERKEIIAEIVDTEIKYGRDLKIIRDEFQRPMQVAGLLSSEQLNNVFLNVDELIEVNAKFAADLKDAVEVSLEEGDEDLIAVNLGRVFSVWVDAMLNAFKSYCIRQAQASATLASLEKEKELLRIFLRVSQMENTILRRMNLSSFLMVPVQRVTKYPLLLSRLLKVTPGHHRDRPALQLSRERIEQHLEHMNNEARDKDDGAASKLWRKISMLNVANVRKMDASPIGLDHVLGATTWGIRRMALDALHWANLEHDDINFVLEARLDFGVTEQTFSAATALLVTLGNGKHAATPPKQLQGARRASYGFCRDAGVRQAALLLFREKNGRFALVREPFHLERCVVCWEQEWEERFELHDFVAKEAFRLKGDSLARSIHWYRYLQFYALSLGHWRRRRNALPNIMINGMERA